MIFFEDRETKMDNHVAKMKAKTEPVIRYAYWPTKLCDGRWVWFEYYISRAWLRGRGLDTKVSFVDRYIPKRGVK